MTHEKKSLENSVKGKALIKALDRLIADGDVQIDHGLLCFLKLSPLDTLKPIMTVDGLAIRGCVRDRRVQIFTQNSEKRVALRCLSKQRWEEALSMPAADFALAPACEKRIVRLIKALDTDAFAQALNSTETVCVIGDDFASASSADVSAGLATPVTVPDESALTRKPQQSYHTKPEELEPQPQPIAKNKTWDKEPAPVHTGTKVQQLEKGSSLSNLIHKPFTLQKLDKAFKGVSAMAGTLQKTYDSKLHPGVQLPQQNASPQVLETEAELNVKRSKRIKQRLVNLSAQSFMGQPHPGPAGSVYIPVQIDTDSAGGLLAQHAMITDLPISAPSSKVFAFVYHYPDHAVGLLVKNAALLDSVLGHSEKVRKLNVDIAHQFGLKAVQGEIGDERVKRFHTCLFETAASYIGIAQSPYTNYAALNSALMIAGSARLLENIKIKGKDIRVERCVPILSLSAALHEKLALDTLAKRDDIAVTLPEALLLGASLEAIIRSYAKPAGGVDLDALSMHTGVFERMIQSKIPLERALGLMGLHVQATVKETQEREAQRPVDYSEQYIKMMPPAYRPEDDIYISKII